jgi:tripartite ATP-independent transporter DctP family solute receptor
VHAHHKSAWPDVQLTIRQRKWFYPRKIRQGETVNLKTKIISGLVVAAAMLATGAHAQEVKHYRFAHDQQLNTGYSVAYDMFSAKLKELSKGTMIVDQYPGAQLGQEPQLLQLVKAGDIEFAIVSSANTATISPQAGVMSLHFLFRNSDHVIKALADQKVIDALAAMIDDTAQGLHVIATGSQGVRSIYSKKEIRNVADMKGLKIRVQATATEDAIFPAYGAQTVHMPFGSVYTSLQTGVVDAAENSVNVYLVNKHYEVAPVLSITEHEANNALVFVSDKLWKSLNDEQKGWVKTAAAEISAKEPAKAFELEKAAATKLKSFGVKIVEDVDKKSFTAVADPYLDKLAKELGPHAEKVKNLIRAIN